MSIHRQAAQRDQNEGELIKVFRRCGWRVQQHTAWDLDALCPRCKALIPVEVKSSEKGRGELTQSQKKLILEGWPILIVRTSHDVANLIAGHTRRCDG